MHQNLNNEIGKLSIPERILLVEDIWDSIAKENEAFELTQSQKDELENVHNLSKLIHLRVAHGKKLERTL